MMYKKVFLSLVITSFLGACTSPTTMLGPAYTLTSSGSVIKAGVNYGTNQMITRYTGKTPIENVQEIVSDEENIQKKTLESEDFYILVKNKIESINNFLKINQ